MSATLPELSADAPTRTPNRAARRARPVAPGTGPAPRSNRSDDPHRERRRARAARVRARRAAGREDAAA